jgi:EpsD family peptidyl-prolyl cis-trans isomerase
MVFPDRASLAAVIVVALAACGGGGGDEKKVTQVAAKVNKDEITVHQVNQSLPRLNNPSEAQAKAVSRQVLDRLVDQQLLIQKAVEQKLDRDPQVMTALESARREILSRAYMDRVLASAPKASAEDVRKYYSDHPELFSERRIYRLEELVLSLTPEQEKKFRESLPSMKTLQDVAGYAKANGLSTKANTLVRSAEQLPMAVAAQLQKVKDGDIVALPGSGAIALLHLLQSKTEPLDEVKATPFIEQYIQNKARMEIAQNEIKHLRSIAKIEYLGHFAKPAEAAGAGSDTGTMPSVTGVPSAADVPSVQDVVQKNPRSFEK